MLVDVMPWRSTFKYLFGFEAWEICNYCNARRYSYVVLAQYNAGRRYVMWRNCSC